MIRGLVGDGVTVLLTTQYLDEADHLAHDIVVIDRGTVVATGTPDELKAKTGGQVLRVAPADPGQHRLALRAAAPGSPSRTCSSARTRPSHTPESLGTALRCSSPCSARSRSARAGEVARPQPHRGELPGDVDDVAPGPHLDPERRSLLQEADRDRVLGPPRR